MGRLHWKRIQKQHDLSFSITDSYDKNNNCKRRYDIYYKFPDVKTSGKTLEDAVKKMIKLLKEKQLFWKYYLINL